MKTLKLSHFEFFRCLEDTFKSVSLEDFGVICPGDPIPANAVVVGDMPHHLKCFLALLTMAVARLGKEQVAFDAATVSGNLAEGLPFPELRSLQENAAMLHMLFLHMLRAEVPPPPVFNDDADPECRFGPNLEIYYVLPDQVGTEVSRSALSFEVDPSEVPRVH